MRISRRDFAAGLAGAYGAAGAVGAAAEVRTAAAGGESSASLKQRAFRFTYSATASEFPADTKVLDLWVPYPESDRNQTIHRGHLTAPGPVTIGKEPKFGNSAVRCRVERPNGPVTLEMVITATRRENAGHAEVLDRAEAAAYLSAEPLVPLDGPVLALALEATAGKRGEAARARGIYEKVTSLLKYDKSGTGWGRGDAIYACDARKGNCTDFHALIIGMARSQGIPARFAIGFSIPEARGAGEIVGYHCWAEMYVRGRWVPVDSSEAAKALAMNNTAKKDYYYGRHDENRIEVSRGRHFNLEPRQQGAPLNFFVYPYAEADGKPLAAVGRKFSYEDVTLSAHS